MNAGSSTQNSNFPLYSVYLGGPDLGGSDPFTIHSTFTSSNSFLSKSTSFNGQSIVGGSAPVNATSTVIYGTGSFFGNQTLSGTVAVTYDYQISKLEDPKLTASQKLTAAAEGAFVGVLIAECPVCGPEFISIAEGLYGNLLQLVADPADSNYMIFATPSAPPVLIPPNIPGLTQQQIDTWANLTQNLALWSTLPGAMLDSINRAQGAYDAGNALWDAEQLVNFGNYYQEDLIYAAAVRTDAEALGLVPSIPEPSPLLTFPLGLGAIWTVTRRRRNRQVVVGITVPTY